MHGYDHWKTTEPDTDSGCYPPIEDDEEEAVSVPRFYDPVDLVLVFRRPDDIDRTKHMGVYQTISDAQEAAGATVWFKLLDGRLLSDCGKWRIQPVST